MAPKQMPKLPFDAGGQITERGHIDHSENGLCSIAPAVALPGRGRLEISQPAVIRSIESLGALVLGVRRILLPLRCVST